MAKNVAAVPFRASAYVQLENGGHSSQVSNVVSDKPLMREPRTHDGWLSHSVRYTLLVSPRGLYLPTVHAVQAGCLMTVPTDEVYFPTAHMVCDVHAHTSVEVDELDVDGLYFPEPQVVHVGCLVADPPTEVYVPAAHLV